MRPVDIEADVKEMERRKRVEAIMNSQVDGGGGTSVYKWQNAAGVEWNLYQYDGDDTLYVGTECPYYKEPYNWSTTTFNATGIVGPFDEFYYYESGESHDHE